MAENVDDRLEADADDPAAAVNAEARRVCLTRRA
jgi:hypothetical protein